MVGGGRHPRRADLILGLHEHAPGPPRGAVVGHRVLEVIARRVQPRPHRVQPAAGVDRDVALARVSGPDGNRGAERVARPAAHVHPVRRVAGEQEQAESAGSQPRVVGVAQPGRPRAHVAALFGSPTPLWSQEAASEAPVAKIATRRPSEVKPTVPLYGRSPPPIARETRRPIRPRAARTGRRRRPRTRSLPPSACRRRRPPPRRTARHPPRGPRRTCRRRRST